MKNVATKNSTRTFASVVAVFVVFQLVATWGTIVTATEATGLPFELFRVFGRPISAHYLHWILTETPYFPIQISLALILGWLYSYSTNYKPMLWVWVLPCAVLCYALVAIPSVFPALTSQVPQPAQTQFSHYFGYGCQPQNRCVDQTVITLPFYTSASYALGALAAQRIRALSGVRIWFSLALGLVILTAVTVDVVLSLRQGVRWTLASTTVAMIPLAIATYLIYISLTAKVGSTLEARPARPENTL